MWTLLLLLAPPRVLLLPPGAGMHACTHAAGGTACAAGKQLRDKMLLAIKDDKVSERGQHYPMQQSKHTLPVQCTAILRSRWFAAAHQGLTSPPLVSAGHPQVQVHLLELTVG